MSVEASTTAAHWIWNENLFHCLTLAAESAGVDFTEQDRNTIKLGLCGTSDLTDTWFVHVLSCGERHLSFAVALDDGDTSTGLVHLKFLKIASEQNAARLREILLTGAEPGKSVLP